MIHDERSRRARYARAAVCVAPFLLFDCSPSSTSSNAASCSMPGEPTPGPADTHCGTMVQKVDPSVCNATPVGDDGGGDDGGPLPCSYGPTMWGGESADAAPPAMVVADDDDCKYHVVWTHGDICEGSAGVPFTITVTYKTDGSKVTGDMPDPEVFTSSPLDASCDTLGMYLGPNSGKRFHETSPGVYTGSIQFDRPGLWTVRFHFFDNGNCPDLPQSPHGHAAFHITVP